MTYYACAWNIFSDDMGGSDACRANGAVCSNIWAIPIGQLPSSKSQYAERPWIAKNQQICQATTSIRVCWLGCAWLWKILKQVIGTVIEEKLKFNQSTNLWNLQKQLPKYYLQQYTVCNMGVLHNFQFML